MFSTISQTFRHHTVNRHFPLTTHTEKKENVPFVSFRKWRQRNYTEWSLLSTFLPRQRRYCLRKVFIRLDFLKTNSIYNGHCHRRSGNLFSFLKHNLKMMEKSCFCLNINKKKKTWKTIGELSMLQNRFIIFFYY